MKIILVIWLFLFSLSVFVSAQEVRMSKEASLEQVYGETYKVRNLMSMNEMSIDFGYVLYETQISIDTNELQLEVENVRDYAAIYIDDKFVGCMTDENKKLHVQVLSGEHQLRLYVENIGRITYGPEIMDNSKGLFGNAFLNGKIVEHWEITPLNVRDCQVDKLHFSECKGNVRSCFFKGTFYLDIPHDTHLNMSGWGMGEVWINGKYAGSYWEENSQLSIPVLTSMLHEGENDIVIFELKDIENKIVRFSDIPVFK